MRSTSTAAGSLSAGLELGQPTSRPAAPETRASRRVIPLPDVVATALRERQKRQDVERDQAGSDWEESGFVFTTRHGWTMSPYTLVKYWHDVREAAGLGTLRFHDLRRTALSLLLALGVPPHVVRETSGHSNIKVTMMVYAHGNLGEKAAALTQLGDALSAGLMSGVDVTAALPNDKDRPAAP
jgi:integrase